MKLRHVSIFTGKKFTVPQNIQRIDSKSTHGWQVRYQGTKMFSDHTADGSGAAQALALATRELADRMAKMPTQPALRKNANSSKTNGLPRGISGPIVRQRADSQVRTCSFSILLPQFGKPPVCRTVYIGSEVTYTVERYKAALAKAIALRQEAEASYEIAATKAKRKDAAALKASLKG